MYGNFIQLKIRFRKSLAGNPNSYSNFTNFSPLPKTDNHTNKKKTQHNIPISFDSTPTILPINIKKGRVSGYVLSDNVETRFIWIRTGANGRLL
jgi:hypothetical protein